MAEEKTATVRLIGPMRFDGVSSSGHTVVMDTSVDGGGTDAGASPMELVLLALAGCTGMDVIGILRKKRQDVTGYEIHVRGVRAEQHPMVYTTIHVEHVVTGRNVDPAAVARAVELSETKYCSVSNMLNRAARIETSYRVVEAEEV
jgi:putative redox protein